MESLPHHQFKTPSHVKLDNSIQHPSASCPATFWTADYTKSNISTSSVESMKSCANNNLFSVFLRINDKKLLAALCHLIQEPELIVCNFFPSKTCQIVTTFEALVVALKSTFEWMDKPDPLIYSNYLGLSGMQNTSSTPAGEFQDQSQELQFSTSTQPNKSLVLKTSHPLPIEFIDCILSNFDGYLSVKNLSSHPFFKLVEFGNSLLATTALDLLNSKTNLRFDFIELNPSIKFISQIPQQRSTLSTLQVRNIIVPNDNIRPIWLYFSLFVGFIKVSFRAKGFCSVDFETEQDAQQAASRILNTTEFIPVLMNRRPYSAPCMPLYFSSAISIKIENSLTKANIADFFRNECQSTAQIGNLCIVIFPNVQQAINAYTRVSATTNFSIGFTKEESLEILLFSSSSENILKSDDYYRNLIDKFIKESDNNFKSAFVAIQPPPNLIQPEQPLQSFAPLQQQDFTNAIESQMNFRELNIQKSEHLNIFQTTATATEISLVERQVNFHVKDETTAINGITSGRILTSLQKCLSIETQTETTCQNDEEQQSIQSDFAIVAPKIPDAFNILGVFELLPGFVKIYFMRNGSFVSIFSSIGEAQNAQQVFSSIALMPSALKRVKLPSISRQDSGGANLLPPSTNIFIRNTKEMSDAQLLNICISLVGLERYVIVSKNNRALASFILLEFSSIHEAGSALSKLKSKTNLTINYSKNSCINSNTDGQHAILAPKFTFDEEDDEKGSLNQIDLDGPEMNDLIIGLTDIIQENSELINNKPEIMTISLVNAEAQSQKISMDQQVIPKDKTDSSIELLMANNTSSVTMPLNASPSVLSSSARTSGGHQDTRSTISSTSNHKSNTNVSGIKTIHICRRVPGQDHPNLKFSLKDFSIGKLEANRIIFVKTPRKVGKPGIEFMYIQFSKAVCALDSVEALREFLPDYVVSIARKEPLVPTRLSPGKPCSSIIFDSRGAMNQEEIEFWMAKYPGFKSIDCQGQYQSQPLVTFKSKEDAILAVEDLHTHTSFQALYTTCFEHRHAPSATSENPL